jgi:O-antigen ligase
MRFLLSALILLLVFCHIFSLDLSLAPGLSAKNAGLYIATSIIGFRLIVSGNLRMEMGGFVACYAALIAYATVTWLVAGLLIEYKGYSLLGSAIILKNSLVDPLIFFLTFLFGVRNSADAIKILKVLLIGGVLIHVATLADAFHIYSLGDYEEPGSHGRMAGPLGEANQYAGFITMFLPALCVAMAGSRGIARTLWGLGAAISFGALLTTASRAAFIALPLAAILGAYAFRNYLSAQKILPWLVKGTISAIIVVAVISLQFGQLLTDRLIGESQAAGLANVSSGRTDFWIEPIERMMSYPITLITGFGWETYGVMGFVFAPHNQYLYLWFTLGVPGVILGTMIYLIPMSAAGNAVSTADDVARPYLIAFWLSVVTTMIVIFFAQIFTPWPYFWSYAGLMMRLAIDARAKSSQVREYALDGNSPNALVGRDQRSRPAQI